MIYPIARRVLMTLSLAAALLSAPFLMASPARAQIDETTSTSEDVAIAFFKTADTNPDFELWAKNSKGFATQSVTQAPEYLYQEKQRLLRLWNKYDPQEDTLTISASVAIELKAIADKEENVSYWMNMLFTDGPVTYFPFKYQDYKIAVIPQKIDTLLIQPLTKEQFELIRADFDNKLSGSAMMYLALKPVKSYIHQPYKIDDVEQWALLTDIATMALKSSNTGSAFWYYTADWYVSPKAKLLNDLYQSKGSSTAPITPQTP